MIKPADFVIDDVQNKKPWRRVSRLCGILTRQTRFFFWGQLGLTFLRQGAEVEPTIATPPGRHSCNDPEN